MSEKTVDRWFSVYRKYGGGRDLLALRDRIDQYSKLIAWIIRRIQIFLIEMSRKAYQQYWNVAKQPARTSMKLRHYVFVLTVTLLCLAALRSLVLPVQANESISCGVLANPVTIDGKWTNANEWKDAFEVPIGFVKGSGEAYFKAKHDQTYLYALVDFVSDAASQANDWSALAMDPSRWLLSTPQTDDFLLIGRWNSPSDFLKAIAWGTGTAWGAPSVGLTSGFNVASSKNADNDPYSASSHLIYEFQVPMSKLNQAVIGIQAVASDRDENMGAWPMVPMEDPSNYAYMTFSSEVVPEFSMVTLALPLLFVAAVFVVRYCGRRREVSAPAFSPR